MPEIIEKKLPILVTAIFVIIVLFVVGYRFFYLPAKTASAASPQAAIMSSAQCNGFKVLQASGWFCIPKGGKPYRLTGPDRAVQGEKPIPRH